MDIKELNGLIGPLETAPL